MAVGMKFCWLFCFCLLAGCTALDRIQNCNFACKSPGEPNPAQLHSDATVLADGVATAGYAGPNAIDAMQMEFADQLKAIQTELQSMAAKDESLQQQFSMMDEKMEKLLEERDSVMGDVGRISGVVEGMQDALENHEAALGGIESHLVDQHANYETLLTGLEQQLEEILAEYEESETTDDSSGKPQ